MNASRCNSYGILRPETILKRQYTVPPITRANVIEEMKKDPVSANAINYAIEFYKLDTRNVKSIKFGVTTFVEANAEFNPEKKEITLAAGRSLFDSSGNYWSPEYFSSIIVHEIHHANQLAEGIMIIGNKNIQDHILLEVDAFNEQLEYLESLEVQISEKELTRVKDSRAYLYNKLDEEHRKILESIEVANRESWKVNDEK